MMNLPENNALFQLYYSPSLYEIPNSSSQNLLFPFPVSSNFKHRIHFIAVHNHLPLTLVDNIVLRQNFPILITT